MEAKKIKAIAEFAINLPFEVVIGVGSAALQEIDILLGGDAPRVTPVVPAHIEIFESDKQGE